MAFEQLRYEVAEGMATITLNCPERLNALDYALKDALLTAFDLGGAGR